MPTLAVGMQQFPAVIHMPTASMGMAPFNRDKKESRARHSGPAPCF
jgi:hypothetical protein